MGSTQTRPFSVTHYDPATSRPTVDGREVVWEEAVALSGEDIIFSINIPQEAVVIPETIDAVRASMSMQTDRLEAVGLTNSYLGMKAQKG